MKILKNLKAEKLTEILLNSLWTFVFLNKFRYRYDMESMYINRKNYFVISITLETELLMLNFMR